LNIYLYYIFEIGLLILVIMAVVVAFKEATKADETEAAGSKKANESPED
jgi:hypothetical protein